MEDDYKPKVFQVPTNVGCDIMTNYNLLKIVPMEEIGDFDSLPQNALCQTVYSSSREGESLFGQVGLSVREAKKHAESWVADPVVIRLLKDTD